MAWPRRGYRGLYRHGGAYPIQGLWGHAAAPAGSGVHGATNPCVARHVSEVPALLTLGGIRSTETGSECDIEHRRSHIGLQDKITSILRYDAPPGATGGAGEGFFRRFPSLSKGIYSFTPHFSHTHRRWGSIGSRGTGRGSGPQGGQPYGISGVNRGSTGTGTGYPAHEMRWFRSLRPVRSRTNPVLVTSIACFDPTPSL